MSIDWNALFQTLTSTAIIVAVLGYISKSVLDQLLTRDIEQMKLNLNHTFNMKFEEYKTELNQRANIKFEEYKTELNQRANEELEAVKKKYAVDLAEAQAKIGLQVSQKERLRELIVRWANPILGAVTSLERRLNNILYTGGFPALSRQHEKEVNPNWSISYDYFMPSTLYLFAQYFCWVTLLEEQLSFELFESQEEKDSFFSLIYEVKKSLEVFPEKKYDGAGRDMQVFTLQQRGIGESLIIREGGSVRCMGYYEFLQQLSNPILSSQLTPLKNLLENLNPTEERRWKRLIATRYHLKNLKDHCEKLLQLERIGPIEEDGKEDLESTV